MKAVITADIINSTKSTTNSWMAELKKTLQFFGKEAVDWEIYRGDEFQIVISNPLDTFYTVLIIKASLKIKNFDAKIAIGFGEIDYQGKSIKDSNGSAFVNSGRTLEYLKEIKKQKIYLKSENQDFDMIFNLIFHLLEITFDKWSASNAIAVLAYLQNQDKNQQEIAKILGITQGAFSKALKRANIDAVLASEKYFQKIIQEII